MADERRRLPRAAPRSRRAAGRFLAALAMAAALATPAAAQHRRALMFSIDQGWANGPVQHGDLVALQRVVASLRAFQGQFDTYALLDCAYADRRRLYQALDLLQRQGVRFMLDVYASDIMTNDAGNAPADAAHGVALSVSDLQALKARYGAAFAGIRVFEVFSMNFAALQTQKNGKSWLARIAGRLPQDDFFQPRILGGLFKFAHDNGMYLVFSDWFWSTAANSAFLRDTVHQVRNQAALAQFSRAYPGTAIIVFADNVPGGAQPELWDRYTRPFLQDGAAGIGLSDQAWICRQHSGDSELNCPVSTMIGWAKTAYDGGAMLVQTEPYWYWWNFPKGRNGGDYAAGRFGAPRESLRDFGGAFGVKLSK